MWQALVVEALEAAALAPVLRSVLNFLGGVARQVVGKWTKSSPLGIAVKEVVRQLQGLGKAANAIGPAALQGSLISKAGRVLASSVGHEITNMVAEKLNVAVGAAKRLLLQYVTLVARELPYAGAAVSAEDLLRAVAGHVEDEPEVAKQIPQLLKQQSAGWGVLARSTPADFASPAHARAVDMLNDPARWESILRILNGLDRRKPTVNMDCDDCGLSAISLDDAEKVAEAAALHILKGGNRCVQFDFGDIVKDVLGGGSKVLGALSGSAVPSASGGGSLLDDIISVVGTGIDIYEGVTGKKSGGSKNQPASADSQRALVQQALNVLRLPGAAGRPFNDAMLQALASYLAGRSEIIATDDHKIRLGTLIMYRLGEVGRPVWLDEPFWASVDSDMRQMMLDVYYYILQRGGSCTAQGYQAFARTLGVLSEQLATPGQLARDPTLLATLTAQPQAVVTSGNYGALLPSLALPSAAIAPSSAPTTVSVDEKKKNNRKRFTSTSGALEATL